MASQIASRATRRFLSSASAAENYIPNLRGTRFNLAGPRDRAWWTGKPAGEAPGVKANGILKSMAAPDLSNVTRKQLRAYFDNSWALTETLFSSLKTEDAFFRPPFHGLRHPKVFYYGHPATVYVNKLRVAGVLSKPVNDHLEHIFEVGVDEMQWDDMSKNHMQWPELDAVHKYRQEVYNALTDVIENHPAFETIHKLEKSPFWAMILGIEHERIHLETSSVLMRELPLNFLQHPENFPAIHPSAYLDSAKQNPQAGKDYPANEFIEVPSTSVHIGKPRDFPSFGWDNEYGSKTMDVKSFKASKYKISNGEFYEFVQRWVFVRIFHVIISISRFI
jgi:5-histidylcysteine sulfoxide synthase